MLFRRNNSHARSQFGHTHTRAQNKKKKRFTKNLKKKKKTFLKTNFTFSSIRSDAIL